MSLGTAIVRQSEPNHPPPGEMVRMVTCFLLVALLLAAANAFVPWKPLALCSRAISPLRVEPPVARARRREKKGVQEQPSMQGKKKVRSARTDPTLSHAHRPIWRLRPCAHGPTLPHAHRIPGAPPAPPLSLRSWTNPPLHIASPGAPPAPPLSVRSWTNPPRAHRIPGDLPHAHRPPWRSASRCAPGPTWFSLSGLPSACSPIRRSFPRTWAKTLFALGLSRPPCVKKTSMHCERATTMGTRWPRAARSSCSEPA